MKPLVLPALILAHVLAPQAGWARTPAALAEPAAPAAKAPASGHLSDADTEALAKTAIAAADPKEAEAILPRLQSHHFKSPAAPERELTLFVQGILEDRAGQGPKAAGTFHKLEQGWPQSSYLAEGQVIMAEAAVARKRWAEAESRLHKSLDADLPAETQRRSQELLLWCLAEQGRAAEGVAVVRSLKPLGAALPSERGLVGILEALCAALDLPGARATQKDYHRLFPDGPSLLRVDLDLAKLLGANGDAKGAAQRFQALIQGHPDAPQADEARLALATLLTDGKLPAKEADAFPSARTLLAGLQKGTLKDGPARQALLIRLRLALKDGHWQEALETVAQVRALHPSGQEAAQAEGLRGEALGNWAQELLDRHEAGPILPYLDAEGIRSLSPARRLGLVRRLALGGLPEAAQAFLKLAPPGERPALLQATLEGTASPANPEGTLALLPGKGETPRESLKRAQASVALHAWPEARTALGRATPGADRIQGVLAYLDRPVTDPETAAERHREVEAWLARATEKGADLEPLAILAADLRVRGGDWRGALALYPPAPQPANRGWVALMRATCQARLGQVAPARESLKLAGDDPAFKPERQALEQRLQGM